MGIVNHYARLALGALGLSVSRTNRPPQDLDHANLATLERVRPFTMTSPERVDAGSVSSTRPCT